MGFVKTTAAIELIGGDRTAGRVLLRVTAWMRLLIVIRFPSSPRSPIPGVVTAASTPTPLCWAWLAAPFMCGAGSAAIAQWAVDHDSAFMHRLGFTRTPPKLGVIRKVFIALNRTTFENTLTQWAETVWGRPLQGDEAPPQACALDGKTACGSFDGLNQAGASAVAGRPRVEADGRPDGGPPRRRRQDEGTQDRPPTVEGVGAGRPPDQGRRTDPRHLGGAVGWFIDTRSRADDGPSPLAEEARAASGRSIDPFR